VVLNRRIQKHFHISEGDDFVKLAVDFDASHTEDRAVQVDVFAASQLGMEAGAHLQKAGDAAVDHRAAGRRFGDAAKDLEERRFASAVAANDANDVATLDFEGYVLKGPKILVGRGTTGKLPGPPQAPAKRTRSIHEGVAEGIAAFGSAMRDDVLL